MPKRHRSRYRHCPSLHAPVGWTGLHLLESCCALRRVLGEDATQAATVTAALRRHLATLRQRTLERGVYDDGRRAIQEAHERIWLRQRRAVARERGLLVAPDARGPVFSGSGSHAPIGLLYQDGTPVAGSGSNGARRHGRGEPTVARGRPAGDSSGTDREPRSIRERAVHRVDAPPPRG